MVCDGISIGYLFDDSSEHFVTGQRMFSIWKATIGVTIAIVTHTNQIDKPGVKEPRFIYKTSLQKT